MEFMQDALAGGRTVRNLTVLNIYTRECVAAPAAPTFRCADVVPSPERLAHDLLVLGGLGREPLGSRTKIGSGK